MNTFHVWTIGCQMNAADARHLDERLRARGLAPAGRAEEADVVILNSCVVRQQAEDKVYGRLHHVRALKARRPGTVVALMGCLVGTGDTAGLRERFGFVDVFMPPSDPTPLLTLLDGREEAALRASEEEAGRMVREAIQGEDEHTPADPAGAVTAFVPAVLGCSHACTYCIIPYRRGREHSRPPAEVLAEVQRLAASGVREVTLLGQIVDRYGRDLPGAPSLARLLREVSGVEGIARVRYLTSHPDYFTDELLEETASNPKVCPHVELPCQSGDDAVLRRMKRGYSVRQYGERIGRIRARLPDAAVHTDVIVGFPGETDAEFENTRALMEAMRFDKAHIAKYSVRPQTYAARHLPDDVPAGVKEERRAGLDALQARIQDEKNAALLHTRVEVLVEGRDRRSGRWRGRTPQDRLVFFDGPAGLEGRLVPVRVDGTGPYTLRGRRAADGAG